MLTNLAHDAARLRRVLARQDGPTVLVGHSYGGQIVTALGEDAPTIGGLVYSAGFWLRRRRVDRSPAGAGTLRLRRSRTSTSTRKASPGCPRTIS